MTAVRLLGVFVSFGLASSLEAQVVDARDSLVYPVNPPRFVTKPKTTSPELNSSLLLQAAVSTELQNARAAGLGPDHPRVKALEAKLAAMRGELPKATPAKTDSAATSQAILDRLSQLEVRQLEKETALSREVAALKAEVVRLQEELKKVRK